MHRYVRHTLSKLSWRIRKLVLYDQLNPSYVKFYREEELRHLVEAAGFTGVDLYHRRGYSRYGNIAARIHRIISGVVQ